MSAQDIWLRKYHELWERLEDMLKQAVQTCKLDLTQYLQGDLIANCVFGESKSEVYIVLNRPLGRRKRVSKCSYHRS